MVNMYRTLVVAILVHLKDGGKKLMQQSSLP